MRYPIANLGQDANTVAGYRNKLREYSKQEQFYRDLAKTDPEYTATADWYADLRDQAQAALTRTIQQGLQNQGVTGRGQGLTPSGMTTTQPYQSYEFAPMKPIFPPAPPSGVSTIDLMNALKMSTDLGPLELPPAGGLPTPTPPPSNPPVATPGSAPRPGVPTEDLMNALKMSTDLGPLELPSEGYQPPSPPIPPPVSSVDTWNRGTAECSPPMVPAPGGGCMPGPGYGGGGGGGGYGGLINMAPGGGAVPFTMGVRIPTHPLMRGRF